MMTLTPGTRFDQYEITSRLGSGGMGEVYRAKDHNLGRDVAIKILPKELASDPERLRRFEQEARSASALNHPNIITIYGLGQHETPPYIAMELVEGKTLREMLHEGPIPTNKLLPLAAQIAEGLARAHAAGIVHRDLKPENLMVTSEGYVKILDFGLAKLQTSFPDTDSRLATVTKKGTAQGTVMGTVGYMSPEQAKGQAADFRSDQFSLGAILYEMVTGTRAFQRDSPVQTLSAIIEHDPTSIVVTHPDTPTHLRVIIERCIEKNREERYDSTRDLARELRGITDTSMPQPPAEAYSKPEIRRPWPRIVAIAAGMAAVVALVLTLNVSGLWERLVGEPGPRIDSIAVLPLENLSGNPEQEFFSDGMTDALIADLAKIEALKVISRTSAMRYKGTDKPLPEIARELHVDGIVEGSVLRAESRVRITAQLIEAVTDQLIWGETYERDLRDVLTLQSEVARSIAQEIEVTLSQKEKALLARDRPVDPEAYEAYLKGSYHLYKLDVDGFNRAVGYFDEAIRLDSDFAPAYARRAITYLNLELWGALQPNEGTRVATDSVIEALEKDETNAEAYGSLGYLKFRNEWDWPGAEEALVRGLELDANAPDTYISYSALMASTGRYDEAIDKAKKALELDPLSPWRHSHVGGMHVASRRYDEATAILKDAIEMAPNLWSSHLFLAKAHMAKGQYEEAIERNLEAVSLSSRNLWALAQLGFLYGRAEKSDRAREILAELEEKRQQQHVSALAFAWLHIGLSENERAFEWLDKAHEERAGWLTDIQWEPIYDPLRSDPRFEELLLRMNFPD